jgi:4-amino-4-deoxy-L-arabinose transferase-like glycosyltransferase
MNRLVSTSIACHDEAGSAVARVKRRTSRKASYLFVGLVAAGLIVRVLFAALPGNAARTPWGGGGDTAAYLLLAHNLVEGKGYAYAGMPTALRAPLYPLLLASFLKLFGDHALAAVRWLQFLEGVAVAFLCAELARRIFGGTAWKLALLFALFSPTLVEMNGEILTEATATLFVTIFLLLLVQYFFRPRWIELIGIGCAVGLGALTRFNMALLAVVAVCIVFLRKDGLPRWQGATVMILLPLMIVSPWFIRNVAVFHGAALFSTHSGLDALEGVLTPQGRALPGDAARLRAEVGWVPPVDIETNSSSRHDLAGEPVLDRQCWKAAVTAWRRSSWRLVPIVVKKISAFWFSTDQLLWTGSFPVRLRLERAAGVVTYWAVLSLALVGWFQLRARNAQLARTLVLYAIFVTAMHLPFVMNTRLRMPFLDPLLAVLASLGALALASSVPAAEETMLPQPVLE